MRSGLPCTSTCFHAHDVAGVLSRGSLVLGIVFLMLSAPGVSLAADEQVPGELIVKFRQAATVLGVQQALAARPDQRRIGAGLHQVRTRPGETVEQVILELEALPEVEYAEPNYIRRLQQLSPPNDPDFRYQWGLHNTGQSLPVQQAFSGQPGADISALAAWAITTGSADVVVAVIDSGIDSTHPDLAANLWRDANDNIGWDFLAGDNDPNDPAGHGTRMAGIIGAAGNNRIGITGVTWDVSLMVLRVFNTNGEGTVVNIAAAIDYAIANGARIINASYGANRFSLTERDAIRRAANAGLLVVAAACNDGADNDATDGQATPCYPASYDELNIIAVAATDNADGLLPSSNYGRTSVDLGAPGELILTTNPLDLGSSYLFVSGTSASAAFVSGAAALLLAQNPGLNVALLRSALLDNVDPAPNLTERTVTGGRLNVARALGSETALEQGSGLSARSDQGSGGLGWFELLAMMAGVLSLTALRLRRRRACPVLD